MSPARRGAGGAGQESATARLRRLLTMVPWLLRRQGVDIDDAARRFGVSREQIESDLGLLFVCGLPGGMPDDLIEAEWESGRVYLGNADTIARPLRLGADEALTLLVGLRSLAEVPGLADPDLVAETIELLESAVDPSSAALARAAGRRIHVDAGAETETRHVPALREALRCRRRVHLRYVVPTRDEATERDVDPMRLARADGGHWYLEGWCHLARDTRLFRLDRIEGLEVLDVDGTPPPEARPRDLARGPYHPKEAELSVTVVLEPAARWMLDYYPHEVVGSADGERVTITMPASDPAWITRLMRRLGGRARVVAPPEMVERIHDEALAALALYPGDHDDDDHDEATASGTDPRHGADVDGPPGSDDGPPPGTTSS
ncbi:helix-turn-helix transcriptional regulator [Mobilicoccus pelagius]|uniref:Proteasome accessory factor C n=1 Tax=Mobilicoccus pelagius NBRC 104925 TaxID=1089455 RepID=H5UTF5_9MICO|nr:WYL domain-containing protein [Mobilicoccus pelagius]GAB49013.1 proteasome accessory factor C [Mobilicoccus pelagius NBRC 104925]